MFTQNFIELSAAVHELSCVQRKKTPIYDIRLLKPLPECRAYTIKLQVKNN